MNDLKTVLITAAGGAGTIEILKSLKATGKYRLIATDTSLYSYGFELADASYIVPFAVAPEFLEAMDEIVSREKPDFLIPLVDEEILYFHLMGKKYKALVVAPTEDFCRWSMDKWQTVEHLAAQQIPAPRSWLSAQIEKAVFPCIVKPRQGRGSRGFALLEDRNAMVAYLTAYKDDSAKLLFQEFLPGTEFTVSVVVDLTGKLLAIVPKEVKIKKGITQVGISREHAEIEQIARDVVARLKPSGPFNIQIKLDAADRPKIIEINPRFSTTVALTMAAGVNEVDLVMRSALGEKVESPKFKKDLMMIRYPAQLIVSESEWNGKERLIYEGH